MQAVEHPLDPEELNEYIDGELPPDRAAVVQAHVAGCATCQKLSADLQHVSRDLATWTVEEPPDHLRATEFFDARQPRASWWPRWLSGANGAFSPSRTSLAALGLGAGVVVVVVMAFWQQSAMQPPLMHANVARSSPAVASEGAAAAPTSLAYSEEVATRARTTELALRGSQTKPAPAVSQPASDVIRTATLRLISRDFDASRVMLDRIVASTGGLLGDVNVTGVRNETRTLKATVRVPAAQFDKLLAGLKGLGDVVNEAMSANDVTAQVIDLEARLANARNTEQRMKELLRTRTGKLTEVLEAEREVSRVREEIERLDAQRKNIASQVTYGTITLTMEEPPKSTMSLGPLPLSLRLRNALVEGFRTAFESAVGMVLFLLQAGPFAIFWLLVLGIPIRFFWRRHARA